MADAKSAIHDLVGRIARIQQEAAQSEALVTELCRDIQSLDTAKRNLTATITALKRLVMLVMALEQLRTFAAGRAYGEAGALIEVRIAQLV